MAVDQAYVDNLATTLKVRLFELADYWANRYINGIDSNIQIDIVRTNAMLKMLENYDVTADYHTDDEFILSINRNWKIYCKYNPAIQVDVNPPEVIPDEPDKLEKFKQYIYNVVGTVSGDEQPTGYTLASTPFLYLTVEISGFPMVIGDGTKTLDVWFSDDGGTTAKQINDIDKGDELYVNTVIIGTDIEPTDDIVIRYF